MINSKVKIISYFLVAAVMAGGYFLYPKVFKSTPPVAFTSIAVLPFENMSIKPDQEYFIDGVTEGIINSISQLKGKRVSSRNSSFRFRGNDVNIKEVGEKLNVETVLEGSVSIDGDRIRITAQLINIEDEFHFWSEQYDERLEDIFAIQDQIAMSIADKLAVTIHAPKLKTQAVVNSEAYQLYLKGRVHWNARTPQDLKKGIEYFEQAVAVDSTYAAAYSGLADCYNILGYGSFIAPHSTFPKAKEAAMKAVQLDSTLSEPHASLGFYYFYYGWDWEKAEEEFRVAIALNPNYSLAYDWFAYYLTAMERYDEAIIMLQKAIELDPLSDPIHTDIGFAMYYGSNYDGAIEKLRSCIITNPRFGPAHLWLGRAYQEQRKYEEAIQEYKTALTINSGWLVPLAALSHVYGISGKTDSAELVLKNMEALAKEKFVTSYGMALGYTGLGKKDHAYECLNKAYEERSNWLVWLKTDPRFISLRGDRQFAEMVSRVGLPQ